jgi:uncharacterized membrane protein YjjP (DUF1212 family)
MSRSLRTRRCQGPAPTLALCTRAPRLTLVSHSASPSATDGQAVELLLHFARTAHEAGGYPANELEPRIIELAESVGLPTVEVSVMPALVELTVGSIPDQRVYVLRVRPRAVDLHAIGRLDQIAAAVADGRLDCRRALEEIQELCRHPVRRPIWLDVAASGLVGGAIAPILGGGWRESLGAAMVGLAVGMLTLVAGRSERSAALATPLGAFVSGVLSSALARAGFHIAVEDVTFAALVVLLPGMPMAIGMRELASGHMQAGMSNSANALVQLVGLALGIAAGWSLAASWLGPIPVGTPDPFPASVKVVGAALVGLAFVVALRAPTRDAIWTCGAAVLAVVAKLVASRFLGAIPGLFAASLGIGVAGNALARRFRRSPLVFIVPGLLMLVPGSLGSKSASSLMEGQTVTGIHTAFSAVVAMLAIAYGLVASTLIIPGQAAKDGGERSP